MSAKRAAKPIGLAIVGAGRIGLIRAEIAVKHPNVGWIGLAEIRADRGNEVAERVRADFCTTDYRELLDLKGIEVVEMPLVAIGPGEFVEMPSRRIVEGVDGPDRKCSWGCSVR